MTQLNVCDLSLGILLDSAWVNAGLADANQTTSPMMPLLEKITLSVQAGEVLALVGESGSGKSLTAQAILRILSPQLQIQTGQVLLRTESATASTAPRDLMQISESAMNEVRGRQIAMIFQDAGAAFDPIKTIWAHFQASLALQQPPLSLTEQQQLAVEWLGKVGIPNAAQRIHEYPWQFSGGQKQRIMIALALCRRPSIILADEPTTALDLTLQKQILSLLKQLQAELNLAVILITHDWSVVRYMADRVAVMYAGQIVETGDVSQLMQQPQHPYTRQLLAATQMRGRDDLLATIEGQVMSPSARYALSRTHPQACRFTSRCDTHKTLSAEQRLACQQLHQDGMNVEHGTAVRCAFPHQLPHTNTHQTAIHTDYSTIRATSPMNLATPPIVRIEHLSVAYQAAPSLLQGAKQYVQRQSQSNHHSVVAPLSFEVAAGRTVAIIGESGCGKTTLLKALTGLLPVQQGRATVSGTVHLPAKSYDLAQLPRLSTEQQRAYRQAIQIVFQDPYDAMNPALRIQAILSEGVQHLQPDCHPTALTEQLIAMMQAIGLDESALTRYPHEFSGGQRQRLAIARALLVRPQVVLLDEPTSALDVSVQGQILNLLKTMQTQHQTAYVLITHNMQVVETMADDILVMQAGQIVEAGCALDVLHQPQHAYTQALLAGRL